MKLVAAVCDRRNPSLKTSGHRPPLQAAIDLTINQGVGAAEDAGDSAFSFFFSFFSSFFSPTAPSFTVFASRVPSSRFQYEPLTSALSTISVILASLPALVIFV